MKKLIVLTALLMFVFMTGCSPHTPHQKIINMEDGNKAGRYTVTFENVEKGVCEHRYNKLTCRARAGKFVVGSTNGSTFTGKESFNIETGELIERTTKEKKIVWEKKSVPTEESVY